MKNYSHRFRNVLMMALLFFIITVFFYWAWNASLPGVFGVPALQFKQASGLIVLLIITSGILGRAQWHRRGSKWFTHGYSESHTDLS